jgi:hypothetical protein
MSCLLPPPAAKLTYIPLVLDSFTNILGPFTSPSSLPKTEYKTTNIINQQASAITPNHPKTTLGYVLIQSVLSSGATASIAYCTVPDLSTIDDVGTRWFITGSNGELETTAPLVQWQISSPDITLRARLGKGSEVETIEFGKRRFLGGNTVRVWQAWV